MMNRTRGPDADDLIGMDFTRLAELLDDPAMFVELDEHDAYGLDDDTREAAATLDALTEAIRAARAAAAAHAAVMADVLDGARAHPEVWVGDDPTTAPDYTPPRGQSVAGVRQRRRDMAVRAATLDIAVRLRLSEQSVRATASRARTLRERCPRLWDRSLLGGVSEQNLTTAATMADSLPDDAPDAWRAFDDALEEPATRLNPGQFRRRARAVRERVHPESIEERHARAARDRAVWLEGAPDGMAFVSALLPATGAHALMNRLDAAARHLRAIDGEERTLAQLRADILGDLAFADAAVPGEPSTGKGHIAITIPVLTLLGASDEPATLDGYGPIPLDDARELAGDVASWTRVLTHPVTGTVLDADTYRVPRALARLVRLRHPECTFPGCRRPSDRCDLDHRVDWALGGATSAENLAPECEPHHNTKHETRWRFERDGKTGALLWVSPTGHRTLVDDDGTPPPF